MARKRLEATLARMLDDLLQQRSVSVRIIAQEGRQIDRVIRDIGPQRQRRELSGRVNLSLTDFEEPAASCQYRKGSRG